MVFLHIFTASGLISIKQRESHNPLARSENPMNPGPAPNSQILETFPINFSTIATK